MSKKLEIHKRKGNEKWAKDHLPFTRPGEEFLIQSQSVTTSMLQCRQGLKEEGVKKSERYEGSPVGDKQCGKVDKGTGIKETECFTE